MAETKQPIPVEIFATPDDRAGGYLRASEVQQADHARTVAQLEHVFEAALFFLGALILWLAFRAMFARSGGRMRRIFGLWLEAKERELRQRAGKSD